MDWIKHAFVTKFNKISPRVYGAFIHLLCTGGFRKEGCALGPDEVFGPGFKFAFHHVTWRLGGQLVRAPTVEQLRAITVGDGCYVSPCCCKNDRTGRKYGNSPVPSNWHPTRTICLARVLAEYEVMRAVPPEQRAVSLSPELSHRDPVLQQLAHGPRQALRLERAVVGLLLLPRLGPHAEPWRQVGGAAHRAAPRR